MTTYSIVDINGFSSSMREAAAKSIAENYTENLDHFVSVSQVQKIIESKSIGLDEDDLFVITEEIFDEIFEDIRSCIYQTALAKLAADGYIECAWDDKSNTMIFWMESKTLGTVNISNEPKSESN